MSIFTTTSFLNLSLPRPGVKEWGSAMNNNFIAIDDKIYGLHNTLNRILHISQRDLPWLNFDNNRYFIDFIIGTEEKPGLTIAYYSKAAIKDATCINGKYELGNPTEEITSAKLDTIPNGRAAYLLNPITPEDIRLIPGLSDISGGLPRGSLIVLAAITNDTFNTDYIFKTYDVINHFYYPTIVPADGAFPPKFNNFLLASGNEVDYQANPEISLTLPSTAVGAYTEALITTKQNGYEIKDAFGNTIEQSYGADNTISFDIALTSHFNITDADANASNSLDTYRLMLYWSENNQHIVLPYKIEYTTTPATTNAIDALGNSVTNYVSYATITAVVPKPSGSESPHIIKCIAYAHTYNTNVEPLSAGILVNAGV